MAPRRHLVRYASVFGPAYRQRAKLRALVSVRVTTEERDLWQTAAGERRLSDWVRDSLNDIAAAAVRRSKPKP